ncbi:PIN domain-containing protein [Aerosakkonemataceae cyanobacterium BLCC-F50]|uniref:PIN domain-containing protein n=1 Tax=Floridaenema flaviceps BLCC-F50 TaxID=3153642 RepID=A0ABV4XKT4_9CYAN
MNEFIRSLLGRYKQQGILIDTNILLLLFVGTVNRSRISQFNRTEKFTPEDYDLLVRILLFFQRIVTTPNILTEVNSLINGIGEPERSRCLEIFANIVNEKLSEFYIESTSAVKLENFTKFGLTDCGIISIARDKYLVLTDDFKLANYLQTINIDVINFEHIRRTGWK